MSRHSIQAREPERFEIIVGYDAPLQTFFAQVIDLDMLARAENDESSVDEDYFALWVGTSHNEILTVEALANALAPYAYLTDEARETLRRDHEREAHPPTTHQREMLAFTKNLTNSKS